ncbi:MAG: glycosyltransferase family 1 protein [Treponema sp.]|jgi:glycosyltransferase involved in cell wall biosynthesis|nr:glycosyltransferase family 1 protein [Treponema sp.]
MRIAYFTDTFVPELNGVTNTLSRLREYLEKKDVHYAFFVPDYNRKDLAGEGGKGAFFENKRVHRFKGLKTALSPESRLAFPSAREIFDRCDAFKPDLVHVVTELGIGYKGLKYAHARGLPLVMSYHTDYCKYLRYFHLDFLEPLIEKYLTWFYRFAHKILAPSKHTLEELFRRQYRNLGIWSRGIDGGKFSPKYRNRNLRKLLGIDDKFVFLYVGRLSPEKGLDMLLYALTEIESRFPGKAAFVFTGGGPYEELIRKTNNPHVILTGFKTGRELSEIYASCDCFAFPSGTETFGNAPLEAMASGLPVAGIAGGGVMEFLSHGQNALLCAAGDQAVFTEHLISIMRGKTLRRRLAKNGRKEALTRTWDAIFEELLGVYGTLIQDSRKGLGNVFRDAS